MFGIQFLMLSLICTVNFSIVWIDTSIYYYVCIWCSNEHRQWTQLFSNMFSKDIPAFNCHFVLITGLPYAFIILSNVHSIPISYCNWVILFHSIQIIYWNKACLHANSVICTIGDSKTWRNFWKRLYITLLLLLWSYYFWRKFNFRAFWFVVRRQLRSLIIFFNCD